jgi:hypothetical protein
MKTMKHIFLKALTATLMFYTTLGASADGKGRLAVGGDVDFLNIGQDGYCGARTTIDRPASKVINFAGDKRTWFRVKSTMRVPAATYTCAGEYSFVPAMGTTYIGRYSFLGDRCVFEFFRAVPGADPTREQITVEESQVCFAK